MAKKRNRGSKLTPEQHAQREEQRRRAREERRLAMEAEAKRAQRRTRIRKIGTGAVVGIAVGAAALLIFKAPAELPGVVRPTLQEARDLAADEEHDYGTPTPTSGPNAAGNPQCGIFDELALADAVNVLEHGGVVLWYDPSASSVPAELQRIADDVGADGVAIAPNPDIDATIVATAWGRLKNYDAATGDLNRFIEIYQDRAPKTGSCPA